jgi:hypothetical protein
MRTRTAFLALAFTCLSSTAFAQGCPPDEAVIRLEVEQLNQLIMDADYDGVGVVLSNASVDGAPITELLKTNFPQGFESCTTLVQREDSGTLKQSAVVFTSGTNTLYVYWRSVYVGDDFVMLNTFISTEPDKVFAKMF